MIGLIIMGLRKLGKNMERETRIFKWSIPRRKTGPNFHAHLLAVKNPKYVEIAKIAVFSFLFHNPNSQVEIHCDQDTYIAATQVFSNLIKRNQVHIQLNERQEDSWQLQKLDLLELIANKELNFYMDCDVRWNDKLTLPDACTTYVEEFNLQDKSPFRELLNYLKVEGSDFKMFNTTFVYLYPGHFSQIELAQMKEFHDRILEVCKLGLVAKLDVAQVERLSEQLGFSLFLVNSRRDRVPLKNHDGHMDGSFLESSYYGATGVEF